MDEAAALIRAGGGRAFTAATARLVPELHRAYALCPEGMPRELAFAFRTLLDFKLGGCEEGWSRERAPARLQEGHW